jgi:O-antigen/teichoic acid export membrane protein
MPLLLSAQGQEIVNLSRYYMVMMIAAYLLVGTPHNALQALGAWRQWNAFRLIAPGLWLAILVVCWFNDRLATPGFLGLAFAFASVFVAIPAWSAIRHRLAGSFRPSKVWFRPIVRYGVPSVLTVLPKTLNLRLDQLLMASFLSPNQLGLYVSAVAWSAAATPIFNAVGPVLFPHMSELRDMSKQGALMWRLIPKLAVALIVTTIALVAITPLMVPFLFGPEFGPAVPASIILVVASGFANLNTTLTAGLQGMGVPGKALLSEMTGLAITMISLLFLLPALGIEGAALASLLAYASVTIMLLKMLPTRHRENTEDATT